jgi:hypothetical protein
MQVTYTQFNIMHRKKMYAVTFEVQDITCNLTRCRMLIMDSARKAIHSESISGRQIMSAWNAKRYLTKALKEKGIIKPKNRKNEHNVKGSGV